MGLFSSEPPSHFPVVQGRRLGSDGDVRFPHDLPADATLLIVSFKDDLDPLSDQWARLADRIAEAHDGRFAVLEVPVVNSKLKLLGGFATMGIRGQVETEAERSRTVPIYADVKAFRKELQVKTGDVYPILVARDGRIAWRGDGEIDMDEVTELEAAVGDVLSQPVPPVTDHPDVDEPEDDEVGTPGDGGTDESETERPASGDAPEPPAEPTASGRGPTTEDPAAEPLAPAAGPLAADAEPQGAPPPDAAAPSTGPADDPPPVAPREDGRTLPPRELR